MCIKRSIRAGLSTGKSWPVSSPCPTKVRAATPEQAVRGGMRWGCQAVDRDALPLSRRVSRSGAWRWPVARRMRRQMPAPRPATRRHRRRAPRNRELVRPVKDPLDTLDYAVDFTAQMTQNDDPVATLVGVTRTLPG